MPIAQESPSSGEITRLLRGAQGDGAAFDRLFPLVYDELRGLAQRQLRRERAGHTLDATGLVHEAYLKMAGARQPDWQGRAHFFAVAARAMRQVLVDYARQRGAAKRGGGWFSTTLTGQDLAAGVDLEQLLALDDALATLEPRQAQVVEMRFFGGMQEEEIAQVLGVTTRTVQRDWAKARAWLYDALYYDAFEPLVAHAC